MSLVIENGTGVSNGNSYTTLDDAITQATQMGLDFAAGTELQLIQGMIEINKYSMEYLSDRAHIEQGVLVDFPRDPFTDNNGFAIPVDTVPQGVINAQIQAAVDILNGYSVYDTIDGKNTSSEEVVGAVKVAYFDNGTITDSQGGNKSIATINYLKPYIDPSSTLISGGLNGEMLMNY